MIQLNRKKRNHLVIGLASVSLLLPAFGETPQQDPPKQQRNHPNIIYILTDDMGYGDVNILNPKSKIKTPFMDQLGKEGMIFTDAHSNSAVCTPTRYGVLTGRYAWRSRLKKSVLGGYSKHLIDEKRTTVASFLKQQGYHTAVIGKWHLGWDWQLKAKKDRQPTNSVKGKSKEKPDNVDYAKPILNGPDINGFDYYYGHCGSLDMPPYVYVENGKVTAAPDRITDNPRSKDKYGWWRKGSTGADFQHIDVMPNFTRRGVKYINERAKEKQPFFLYFPLAAPHTPILPTKEFQGKSGTNPYGDFVMQVDWTIGQLMKALKDNGIEENTLIIMTSDNGCSNQADFEELAKFGHNPNHVFRGHKADIFEGGHRVPFIMRWPARVKAGSVCNDVTCLTDLLATTAEIVGVKLADEAGVDSVSMLSNMTGTAKAPAREATIHHSINGSFSIRKGKWKLEFCAGSGGWSYPRPGKTKDLPPLQLYDMEKDIGETTNLYGKHPEVTKELTAILRRYVEQGRSTPGAIQQNSEGNIWWKGLPWEKSSK